MQEKLDMMKRENGAERLWKSRLLEILSTVTGLLIVVCGESSLCLWNFFSFMLFGISPCLALQTGKSSNCWSFVSMHT